MVSESGFSMLDTHFARFLAGRSGFFAKEKELFFELVARLSRAMAVGHSCLPLSEEENALLKATHLVSDGRKTPLVIHNCNLYLHRYYHYEYRLACQLKVMADIAYEQEDNSKSLLDRYFGQDNDEVDWQKIAAGLALNRNLTIISGGPGTGKTSTVVRIIALFMESIDSGLRIALAAPTGKAAMRLQLSIAASLDQIICPEKIRMAIPKEARTLHRLLGVRRNSPQFRHNSSNTMSWDVVVVDEASMVDLALMSKLVDALKPGARLILLGDKDQLSSVESGSVLADCIKSLPENTVELLKSYRFDGGIKSLAESINNGDFHSVWSILHNRKISNASLLGSNFSNYIGERYCVYMEKLKKVVDVDLQEIFAAFTDFQVLCSVHLGERGVTVINRKIEFYLAGRGFGCKPDSWYDGRPVLITRNDYSLELYNGDIGICLVDRVDNSLKVWFEDKDGGFKSFLPYRLPKCETAFTMTIHKSQGSEFNEVLVVLPEKDNRVLCRELLYTAVTRARQQVKIVAEKEVMELALSRRMERYSGLAGQLDTAFSLSSKLSEQV